MDSRFSRYRPLTDEEEVEIQRMIADDPDDSDVTEEDIKSAMPFCKRHPELAAKMKAEIAESKRLASRNSTKKILDRVHFVAHNSERDISIAISSDVLEKLESLGNGWQDRVNDILRKAVGL